jgi:hypothetical protein
VVERGSECGRAKGLVANLGEETGRSLPILRDKWEYGTAKGISQPHRKTRLQMDKQAKPEAQLQLEAISVLYGI